MGTPQLTMKQYLDAFVAGHDGADRKTARPYFHAHAKDMHRYLEHLSGYAFGNVDDALKIRDDGMPRITPEQRSAWQQYDILVLTKNTRDGKAYEVPFRDIEAAAIQQGQNLFADIVQAYQTQLAALRQKSGRHATDYIDDGEHKKVMKTLFSDETLFGNGWDRVVPEKHVARTLRAYFNDHMHACIEEPAVEAEPVSHAEKHSRLRPQELDAKTPKTRNERTGFAAQLRDAAHSLQEGRRPILPTSIKPGDVTGGKPWIRS